MLSNGNFIPKWKHEDKIKNAVVENCTPEVKVIVNGHRYNVIWWDYLENKSVKTKN